MLSFKGGLLRLLVILELLLLVNGREIKLNVNIEDFNKPCKAVKFRQPIIVPGCESIIIHNKLCVGTCSTFFQPNFGQQYTGKTCQPEMYEHEWKFLCAGGNLIKKKINIVTSCNCKDVKCFN